MKTNNTKRPSAGYNTQDSRISGLDSSLKSNQSPRGQVKSIPYLNTDATVRAGAARMMEDSIGTVDFSTSTTSRRGAGGRSSILRSANQYMTSSVNRFAPLTAEAMIRRYRRIDKEVDHLYKNGLLSTVTPMNMTPEDICNFLTYRTNLNVSPSEMIHEIAALSNLFGFIGSQAVETCLKRYPHIKPVVSKTPFPSMDDKICNMIFEKSMTYDLSNWKMMRAYGVVVFALATGLRSKEMRLCNIDDFTQKDGSRIVIVRHPKGEGTYGKQRPVFIDPQAYPFLDRYFEARKMFLAERKDSSRALFPGGQLEGGHLAGNTIRTYKDLVQEDIGTEFDLRACRRTYGQRLINKGAGIDTTSKMLGHKNTVTTENCYCGLDQMDALNKVASIFGAVTGNGTEFESVRKAL